MEETSKPTATDPDPKVEAPDFPTLNEGYISNGDTLFFGVVLLLSAVTIAAVIVHVAQVLL